MMFRTGIVSSTQLVKLQKLPRIPPAIAFTLLAELSRGPLDEHAIELIYERMPAGAGTGKRKLTYPGRYRAVDDSLHRAICDLFSSESPIRIHEMAASNAITSLEMFSRFSGRPNLSVHASDYYDALTVVKVKNWQVVFDAANEPVQFINGPLVISGSRPEPKRYVVNRMIRRHLLRQIVPEALSQLAMYPERTDRIPLFHPRCVAVAKTHPNFTLGRDNLFDPAPGMFEVIRVMSGFENVAAEATRHAIVEISNRLVEGGLLVIGQSTGRESNECRTTIFRKAGRRFNVATEIMGGSYLTPLVSSLNI